MKNIKYIFELRLWNKFIPNLIFQKRIKNMKILIITSLLILNSANATIDDKDGFMNQLVKTISTNEVWNLDLIGLSDNSDPLDRFGEAISHGDYNNDGWQDLAIGIPNYDFFFGAILNTGTVLVLYGTANGLTTDGAQYLFQTFETDPPNFENSEGLEANDFFGQSLASGDFNCDGYRDLAVGTPEEDVTFNGSGGLRSSVGVINIFYGSALGFTDNGQGSTFIHQAQPGNISFDGGLSAGDRFGWSMAVGNFNGDSENSHQCQDLAVSAPFEDFGNMDSISDGGQVNIYYGSLSGLDGEEAESLAQNSANADDTPESNDQFGLSLAAGRFRDQFVVIGPQYSDLAIGIPGQDVDGQSNAGAVQVFNGGSGGLKSHLLSADDDTIWSQSGAIEGAVEANDRFGYSLISGDFNADQSTDLVVGVPQEDINADGINDAGAINVIYGSLAGLTTLNNQIFIQGDNGILGLAEDSDRFGDTFTSGDVNYDFYPDLIVGVPRENGSSGAFHIIHGGVNGLSSFDNEYITNFAISNIGDEMGLAMTIADFGNGPELVVGLPGDDSIGGDNDSGSVQIFEFENPDVIFKNEFE